MLVGAVLMMVSKLLTGLIGLLPAAGDSFDLPPASNVSSAIGTRIGPFDRVAPMHEGFAALWFVLSVLFPPLFAYRIAVWVWSRLPIIGRK